MSNKRLRAAHTKGRQARIAGESLTANPYKREDYQRAWDDGWYEADQEQDVDEPGVVAHEPQVTTQTLGTVSFSQTPNYYYKMPAMPCPKCEEVYLKGPMAHRRAITNLNSTRHQALMYCRACEYRFILPVKYPPGVDNG